MFLDAHSHFGKWQENPSMSVDEMIAIEKTAGFSGAVSAPLTSVLSKTEQDLDDGNAEALELWAKYPDFFYPGVLVHPSFQARSLYWLDAFRERGLVWCGEWLSYVCNVAFDDPAWAPFFEYAQKNNWIVQMHNDPSVATVAKRYPDLTMVGAHLNPEVLPLLVDCPNAMVDVSGLQGGLVTRTLPKALALLGADRLLLGTDTPGYDPEPFIMRAKRDFNKEDLEKISSKNLLKLLKDHGVKNVFGMEL